MWMDVVVDYVEEQGVWFGYLTRGRMLAEVEVEVEVEVER